MVRFINRRYVRRPNDLALNPALIPENLLWLKKLTSTGLTDVSNTGIARDIQQGRCYDFDGANDHVDIDFVSSSTSFSFSMWVKSTQSPSYDFLYDQQTVRFVLAFNASINNNIGFYDGSSWHNFGASPNDGNWHHLVWNFDNGTATLYVDNVQLGSTISYSVNSLSNAGEQSIGAAYTGGNNPYDGCLFDFRVFDRVVTPSEINDLYNHKLGVASNDLIAWYKMDEKAGSVAYDSSGNGKHGVITGTTASTFHAVQNEYSFQNQVGYTSSGSTLIPRDESSPAYDVLGNPLQYTGLAPLNAQFVGSNCATFDGVDDYGLVPSDEVYNIGTDDFTMVFRGKLQDTGTWQSLFSIGYSNYSNGLAFYINPSEQVAPWRSGLSLGVSTGKIKFNQDTVITLSREVGQIKISIDGVVENLTTYAGQLGGASHEIRLGSQSSGLDMKGQLYDFIIYNKALSQDEISQLNNWDIDVASSSVTDRWVPSSGAGSMIYNVISDRHAQIQNATESNLWSTTQDKLHWNIVKGFSNFALFDGVNDRVDFADTGVTTLVNKVELDFYVTNDVTATSPTDQVVSFYDTSNHGNAWYFGIRFANATGNIANEVITVLTADAPNHRTGVIGITIPAGWNSLKIEWNGSYYDIYLNGVKQTVTNFGTAVKLDARQVALANGIDRANAGFTGGLRNVKIYDESDNLVIDLPLNEGSGTTIYDKSGNNRNGIASHITQSSFWGTKIPALSDGSNDASGSVITNPAGDWHNNAETKLQLPQAPTLIEADKNNYWFDSSGNANEIDYSDLVANVGYYCFADVSVENQYKNIVIFSPSLKTNQLALVNEFINYPYNGTHVFLLAGQSNMVGRPSDNNSGEYPNNVYQYSYSDELIKPAISPLDHYNEDAGDMGLARKFCIDYAAANPGVNIVLIPRAAGATGFSGNHWNKGDAFYNDAVNDTNSLLSDNPDWELKGILWHQGEGDQSSPSTYEASLHAMIQNMRNDINAASDNTPFILGNIKSTSTLYNATVNMAIENMPNTLNATAVVNTEDLTHFDGVHYDTNSLDIMGARYYTALTTIS